MREILKSSEMCGFTRLEVPTRYQTGSASRYQTMENED